MAPSVTIDEAALLLGVCRRTVYYRIKAGRLATRKGAGGGQRVLVDSLQRLARESHRRPVAAYNL